MQSTDFSSFKEFSIYGVINDSSDNAWNDVIWKSICDAAADNIQHHISATLVFNLMRCAFLISSDCCYFTHLLMKCISDQCLLMVFGLWWVRTGWNRDFFLRLIVDELFTDNSWNINPKSSIPNDSSVKQVKDLLSMTVNFKLI